MKNELKNILFELGLSEAETTVFLASLELGSGVASNIAKIAHLNRVTTYEILKRLSQKGLIKIRAKKNSPVKYFIPEDILTIKEKLEEKKEGIEKIIEKIDQTKEDLGALFTQTESRPMVLFYEGQEGIKTVLKNTLKEKPEEILSFASAESLKEGFDNNFLENYWGNRVRLGIHTRGILPKNKGVENDFSLERNKRELRQLKFIPPDIFNFKNEIDIYGDNVGITSHAKGNEYGIIIRSKSIAKSMKAVFEAMWILTNQSQ